MRTKKMQQGGMPPMNKMGQRKAMTNSAAKKRGDTFREPEHGGPSMPLAADVERNLQAPQLWATHTRQPKMSSEILK